jgi:hypothetical protein
MRSRKLLFAFLVVGTATLSSAQTPLGMKGIRFGLDQSPGDYVAGVFKHVGPVQCEESRDGPKQCWARVLVVDEVSSRPTNRAPRRELKVTIKAEPGRELTSRFIAFLVPSNGTDTYTSGV